MSSNMFSGHCVRRDKSSLDPRVRVCLAFIGPSRMLIAKPKHVGVSTPVLDGLRLPQTVLTLRQRASPEHDDWPRVQMPICRVASCRLWELSCIHMGTLCPTPTLSSWP